jgi:hypothetical protein
MKKGNSHSKACMAARTRSLDVLDATDGKSFEEIVTNFMTDHAFKARKGSVFVKPTDVDVMIFDGERIMGKLPMIVEKYTGSHLEGKMFAAEINGRSCHCGMDFLRVYLHALEINQERV